MFANTSNRYALHFLQSLLSTVRICNNTKQKESHSTETEAVKFFFANGAAFNRFPKHKNYTSQLFQDSNEGTFTASCFRIL